MKSALFALSLVAGALVCACPFAQAQTETPTPTETPTETPVPTETPTPTRTPTPLPWPMFRHDPRRTGVSPYKGPLIPRFQWSYFTGGAVDSSPAVDADGTVDRKSVG